MVRMLQRSAESLLLLLPLAVEIQVSVVSCRPCSEFALFSPSILPSVRCREAYFFRAVCPSACLFACLSEDEEWPPTTTIAGYCSKRTPPRLPQAPFSLLQKKHKRIQIDWTAGVNRSGRYVCTDLVDSTAASTCATQGKSWLGGITTSFLSMERSGRIFKTSKRRPTRTCAGVTPAGTSPGRT